MKTAISIPDSVFAEAEDLAHRLEKSRSQLYSEAVAEYLARHDADEVTEAMNQVIDVVGSSSDRALAASTRRLLERVEW
jgi:metal-responsive CopG/Arc/MetJ family transcriptional regulator